MSAPRVVRGTPVPLATATRAAAPKPAAPPKLPPDPAAAFARVLEALGLPDTATREAVLAAVGAVFDVASPAGIEAAARAFGLPAREVALLASTPGANVAEYVRLRPKHWKR